MTREEAITRLKNMDIREAVQEDYEAIDMAISALSIPIMEYPQVDGITPHLIDEPSDLISRAEAKIEIYTLGKRPQVNDIWECLDRVPSVSAERVVRCKDCKYVMEHYDTDGNAPYWTCSEWDSGTDYDGFCHYGERRE